MLFKICFLMNNCWNKKLNNHLLFKKCFLVNHFPKKQKYLNGPFCFYVPIKNKKRKKLHVWNMQNREINQGVHSIFFFSSSSFFFYLFSDWYGWNKIFYHLNTLLQSFSYFLILYMYEFNPYTTDFKYFFLLLIPFYYSSTFFGSWADFFILLLLLSLICLHPSPSP